VEGSRAEVVILISGGIDSAALLNYFIEDNFYVRALFIDYGQKASIHEYASARKICKYYGVKLKKLSLKNNKDFGPGEILGRNGFLVFSALMHSEIKSGFISLGIHSGTPYYDCSKLFVDNVNNILLGYYGGQILLTAPFLNWTKRMIFDYCAITGIPLSLTYSCENGSNPPCGVCPSCIDRGVLDVQ